MNEASSESPADLIDWSAITASVECPLCLYNLRGLIEPRCPECGLQFEWPELLDPQRQRHRYLFEHHAERNLWSFFRTVLGGLRPRKFWTTLKPNHTVNSRRLLIYWFLCSCLLLLVPAAEAIQAGVNLAEYNAWSRLFPVPGTTTGHWPSAQAKQRYIDANFPLPPSRTFLLQYAQVIRENFFASTSVELGTIAVWPWLTFAALMIFQASMRKARVQRGHVLRCVIYAADASVWYTILMLAAMAWLIALAIIKHSPQPSERITFWLLLLLWVVRLDRLTTAYRKYLQFDHPFLTALVSQIIVLLVMGAILFWSARLLG